MLARRTVEATSYVALSAALGTVSFIFLLVTDWCALSHESPLVKQA